MARSDTHPVHRFEPWQVWPGSFDNPPVDGNFPCPDRKDFTLTRATPIASMGSCFAREIKRRLLQRGFAYIAEETDHPAAVHASAAWERVYNTFCMRQIFEYTFEERWAPALRWWGCPGPGRVQDPLPAHHRLPRPGRRGGRFARHREHSRRALETAQMLIMTLGLTEIWQDREDGSVISLPAGPYVSEGGDMSRYAFRVSRYPENLANLERIHAIMATPQPGLPPPDHGLAGQPLGDLPQRRGRDQRQLQLQVDPARGGRRIRRAARERHLFPGL